MARTAVGAGKLVVSYVHDGQNLMGTVLPIVSAGLGIVSSLQKASAARKTGAAQAAGATATADAAATAAIETGQVTAEEAGARGEVIAEVTRVSGETAASVARATGAVVSQAAQDRARVTARVARDMGNAVALAARATGDVEIRTANYQAYVAHNNQILSNIAADDALTRGRQEAAREGSRTAQIISQQRVTQAALGQVVDRDSALDLTAGEAEVGAENVAIIRENAEREAFGFRTQAFNFAAEHRLALLRSEGSTAATESRINLAFSEAESVSDIAEAEADQISRITLFEAEATAEIALFESEVEALLAIWEAESIARIAIAEADSTAAVALVEGQAKGDIARTAAAGRSQAALLQAGLGVVDAVPAVQTFLENR